MTLVIAEKEAGRVIMGADSAGVSRGEVHAFPGVDKIFQRGPYLVPGSILAPVQSAGSN